jgi:GNAT superfamily N-acetyltransferase
MWWRTYRRTFEENRNAGNRKAMKSLVDSGEVPGILAYWKGSPIGWCSIAPRETYGALERSPVLKRLDDEPVWSLACFFVAKDYRDQGVSEALIQAAISHVRRRGGRIIEAYANPPREKPLPPVSSYMGFADVFERAGFVECARPSKSKIIMRYVIEG